MKYELDDINRKSLGRHLLKGEYYMAEQKIEDNLSQILLDTNELEKYSNKIKNKQDDKDYIIKGNLLIGKTGKIFEETIILINDFRIHANKFTKEKYKDKVSYLTLLKSYDERLNKYKSYLDKITKKINENNYDIIETKRESIIKSRRETGVIINDPESKKQIEDFRLKLSEGLLAYDFKEDIDDKIIEERGKQIQMVGKIMEELNKLSKDCAEIAFKSGAKVDLISEHLDKTNLNITKAKDEIKKAEEINKETNSSNGIFNINKLLMILICFVGILFIIAVSNKR